MEFKILPNDVIRYIVTEVLEYEIIDDNPSHLLKSLFGRFEGEKRYFLVFRHLFTRIIKSKFFRFNHNDLYPKDAYSIEYRPLPRHSDPDSIFKCCPWVKNNVVTHFIAQFPHLVVLKNFQFKIPFKIGKKATKMMYEEFNRVYKLTTLHLVKDQCFFILAKNFPEIQDFSLRYDPDATCPISGNLFLEGIELCQNLVHFSAEGLSDKLWTCTSVESLFQLPNIKTLKLKDCHLLMQKGGNLNMFALETSVVQEVLVGDVSTRSLRVLLSNTNIRSLSVDHFPSLTGSSSLFDLVLKKERFSNECFEYVAGVSLLVSGYTRDVLNDYKGFLTRGKFDHLKVYGGQSSLPEEILDSIPRLKTLEFMSSFTSLMNTKRIVPIMVDEIILNNEGDILKNFVPPPGCKNLQLNNVTIRGDELKRLMGLGIEITFDGLEAEKVFGKMDGLENHCFNISMPDSYSNLGDETDSDRSANDSDSRDSQNSNENSDQPDDDENVSESEDQDDSQPDSEEDRVYYADDGRRFKKRKYASE